MNQGITRCVLMDKQNIKLKLSNILTAVVCAVFMNELLSNSEFRMELHEFIIVILDHYPIYSYPM